MYRTGVAVIAAVIRAHERRIAQRTGVIRTRVKLLEDGATLTGGPQGVGVVHGAGTGERG